MANRSEAEKILEVAVAGIPQIAKVIADFPIEFREGALEVAERRARGALAGRGYFFGHPKWEHPERVPTPTRLARGALHVLDRDDAVQHEAQEDHDRPLAPHVGPVADGPGGDTE